MARFMFRAAAMIVVISAWTLNSAEAQMYPHSGYGPPHSNLARQARFAQPVPYSFVRPAAYGPTAQMAGTPARLPQSAAVQPAHLAAPQNNPQQAKNAPSTGQVRSAHSYSNPPLYSSPRHIRSGYPYLDAPLYSSPQQYVPHRIGSTLITNQALSPHEMLYPHQYKALYPPFYYKVKGHWFVTPCGVWSDERWKLMGTQVKVKYRPHISLFSGFVPPVVR